MHLNLIAYVQLEQQQLFIDLDTPFTLHAKQRLNVWGIIWKTNSDSCIDVVNTIFRLGSHGDHGA